MAIPTYHTVAGDGYGQPIGRTHLRHRPHRPRVAHPHRQLPITNRLASGNALQGVPHLPLEGRALNIERQGESGRPRGIQKSDHIRHLLGKGGVGGELVGVGETAAHLRRQQVGVIPQFDGTNALRRGRHHHPAQRKLRHRQLDGLVDGSVLVSRWLHAQHGRGLLIKAAPRAKTRLLYCVCHRGLLMQGGLYPRLPLLLAILLGRNAHHLLEQPLEMEGA